MKAYQIFLFLFIFGLVSASVDAMGIMSRQQIAFAEFNEAIEITEIHEMTEMESESSILISAPKMLMSGAKVFGSALVNMVYIIPLFEKYGVPTEITYMFQTIVILLVFIGLFSIITGRSTKQSD